jgi:hypothetical protein
MFVVAATYHWVGLHDIHANQKPEKGTNAGNTSADGDGRWLFAGQSRTMSVNKDIL